MIKKYLQKIYLALIFIILYAPIVTLIVLSFNQSKTRAKWGGFTLKRYKELLKNEQIMSAFCYPGYETEMENTVHGSYKHSYDERGDCNGCFPDAPLYCFSYDTWLRNDPDRPYYV